MRNILPIRYGMQTCLAFVLLGCTLAYSPSQAQVGKETVRVSIGSTSATTPEPWAITDKGQTSNLFSPLTLNSFYKEDQWGADQETNFAKRGIWNNPLWVSSIGVIESKNSSNDDGTRTADQVQSSRPINYIAMISQGIITKGAPTPGSWLKAIGKRDIISTAFIPGNFEADVDDDPGVEPLKDEPINFLGFRATECFTGVSGQITGLINPSNVRQMDSRRILFLEDQLWNASASVVKNFIGARSIAWIDNQARPNESTPKGYVKNAAATRNVNITNVPKSGFNVFQGTGISSGFWFFEILWRMKDSDETDKVDDHRIDDWCSLEISSPVYSDTVDVFAKTGVYIEDPHPSGPSGSPLLVPYVAGYAIPEQESDQTIYIEQVSSIIARSDAVLANIEQAKTSEIVHVRDILHLSPLKDHPSFDPDTEWNDRTGILYFNASQNRLYFSMAVKTGDPDIDAKKPVAWIPLSIDISNAYLPDGGDADNIGDTPGEKSSLTETYESLSVQVQNGSQLIVEGFNSTTPSAFWRRKGYGVEQRGKTDWTSFTPENWTSSPAIPSSVLSNMQQAADDGFAPSDFRKGMEIEIILVHPTTRDVAGTVFRLI